MSRDLENAIAPMSDIPDSDQLFAEATAWYYRLQAQDVTPAERQAFVAWQAQGAAHAQAWEEVIGLLGALQAPARHLCEQQQAQWRAPRRRAWTQLAGAAAAVVMVGLLISQTPWLDRWRADYSTSTGESRSVQLEDGSRIQLNTDSALQVELTAGERRVRLLRGEAWFEVTRDTARPFVVRSGDGLVRVLGTRFSVAHADGQTRVQLALGKVEVRAGGAAQVLLQPGQAVEYTASGPGAVHAFEPSRAFAWRERQLVFSQQPLAEVVAELNRYWPGQTLVLGDTLRQRKVSGVFDIDKPDAVLKALSHTLGVQAQQFTPYLRILRES
ncbi:MULTISPECIES: FecR family protein [unclassified Pseudomonas]|uniref:FecR family protein n=1 Tax=unclassified Pseudomonas TaxID=196821 RepID=UPI00244C933B|nr:MULTISPECIES: FecR family protein [unclassified Pseudomonas]MDH0302655.1 FecR family protein [Pseudomonas sp. GD04091]MDH1983626.1 FecR family protein [Pseudomonas sp. GD03689]